ncbi:MAG: deaminase [Candidatus Daviesbacteria bacterium]
MKEDRKFLRFAYELASEFSTDASTQNGAVLVDKAGDIVAWGVNRFPKGVKETSERLVRPTKYLHVIHAEVAAILDAARKGVRTEGLTMYAPWSACSDCAKNIIEAGIIRVVAHRKPFDLSYNQWTDSISLALNMFQEARVSYELYDGDISGIEILFNGKLFNP